MKIRVTLGEYVDVLLESGVTFEQIEAVISAKKSQHNPHPNSISCVPACGKGFICNTDTGECTPDVGTGT